jgi:prolyl-tRNA synthetase
MKDAYSFDKDGVGLDKNYQAMYNAYRRIFKRCGLNFLTIEADPGVMGGNISHEFMVPAEDGEDVVLSCQKCKIVKAFSHPAVELEAESRNAGEESQANCSKCNGKLEKLNCIEVGHIFKLGTKYSSILGANFLDAEGKQKAIIMGCYGIGVSRLISAVIEQNHDTTGIIWPNEVSPYKVIILPLDTTDKKIMRTAEALYKELKEKYGIETLLDDRDERAGVKFKDADLIGISLKLIIGKESLKNNTIELVIRRNQKKIVAVKSKILGEIKKLINLNS